MQERYNTALKRGAEMADDLKRKTRDLQLDTAALGATGAEAIKLNYNSALNDVGDEVEDLRKQINDLMQMTGGSVKFEGLRNIAKDYLLTRKKKVDESYEQGLKDLLPSLAEYDAKIAEVTRGKRELNEVEKLNAEITLKGLDIVAQSNPKQAERNRLLREQAARLDEVTAKQKADSESIGAGIQQRLQDYYNSVKDLGGAIGDAVVGGLQGLEDQLTAFVTTGKANFKELAVSILSDLARIAIRAAIIQPIVKALGGLFPGFQFADGGVFAQNGIQKFAMGGVVNRPTIFPFANGTGLMGEAGPEAIMPLQRGANGKLGVIASGGGNTSVVVNVDASGNTTVQGDQAQAKHLGVAVSAAVQAELVKQQRPGGLLAGTRR
jgi:lambda family phage tail tape measure protein